MKHFLSISLIFILSLGFAQTKIQFKLDGGKGYFSAYPPPETPKGILIIMPDYLQEEDDFHKTHNIMKQAFKEGIVTVVVTVGRKIFADGSVVELLSEVCQKTVEGFEVPENNVIFGGYGYGGTILLKYAQLCLKYEHDFPLQPAAVYAVNSHVDMTVAFKSYERQIERNLSVESVEDARNFKAIMLRTLQGTPEEDPFIYQSFSPFIYGDKSVDHIEMLVNTPIRLYNDTDLIWNVKNRHVSAFDMPATACSEFIYQLNRIGNNKAEFISTSIENPTGSRNTTRRNFVDERDLFIWMVKQLGIQ